MKKEYFLLILAIIALSAYLFFHNKNQDNYLLPKITNIDKTKIESIEITQNNQTIRCFKDKGEWFVTENKYPVNKYHHYHQQVNHKQHKQGNLHLYQPYQYKPF